MADKALKRAVGEQPRATRLARGLTQEQFAETVGLTPRYYAALEAGVVARRVSSAGSRTPQT